MGNLFESLKDYFENTLKDVIEKGLERNRISQ